MKQFWFTIAATVAGILIGGAGCSASRISDIEKQCGPSILHEYYGAERVQRQMTRIRRVLRIPNPDARAKGLASLSARTRWGSPERVVTSLACAWYDVDYRRSRDYLLNCAFWNFRHLGGRAEPPPFCWAEDTFDVLYKLYEHNHDYLLLHDLLTGGSDGEGEETLEYLRSYSFSKHPRGVLHVAAISRSGVFLAAGGLVRYERGGDLSQYDKKDGWLAELSAFAVYDSAPDSSNEQTYIVYVNRVASDPKDPLRSAAKRVIALAKRLEKVRQSSERSGRRRG